MIQRGLFFRSVTVLQFDSKINKITIEGIGTELNKQNSKQVFQDTAKSPFYIATILPAKSFARIDETLDHFYIVDGKMADPLMFTFMTDRSSFTFGKSWFLTDSPIKFNEIIDFMKGLHKDHQVKMMVDGINFLIYGE
jgi:hypothetical protein